MFRVWLLSKRSQGHASRETTVQCCFCVVGLFVFFKHHRFFKTSPGPAEAASWSEVGSETSLRAYGDQRQGGGFTTEHMTEPAQTLNDAEKLLTVTGDHGRTLQTLASHHKWRKPPAKWREPLFPFVSSRWEVSLLSHQVLLGAFTLGFLSCTGSVASRGETCQHGEPLNYYCTFIVSSVAYSSGCSHFNVLAVWLSPTHATNGQLDAEIMHLSHMYAGPTSWVSILSVSSGLHFFPQGAFCSS